ncbi:5'-nucleotidase C-terminal domain-containing protein [Rhodococcus qingshengii]|uniref:bifunctional metallophosphatase/5'-nucleotidase n=1 Tax=Rhodococcus TaxID=1827 RepID=UPI0002B7DF47|nr:MULTISPECIES: 5'-nucleotidase C-terminal domain-containing protein [Rhodococcus]AZI59933.1 bifunctional metallophosphatase/5'-nucleotidase [Rhodococcus sp. NJ-530]EME20214.1 nucleotidase [Rhodococcus qingshengii BKS 20-40]MBS3694279.1 5'-nucleotidase C-terminal domain-containing protein [Rhodococcus qingshengii]MDJ0438105.1 5'-nucleotidase C-terminal domain-containing protein [Rhodococcus qingshengii]QPG89439.1 5'-nucleotidase C-terminal domain-containing protein [Rhodococcus qingshengii]
MTRRMTRTCAVLATTLLATTATSLSGVANAESQDTVSVRLLAFNDLHGSLRPPEGVRSEIRQADGSLTPAGGAAYLAAYVTQLRSQATNSLLYSVGDNWGSSALESAMFNDEPTVELLNRMKIDASAIGNHELDKGLAEFRRMQSGGCSAVDACTFSPSFDGANFPLMAANMTYTNGTPATLPFTVNMVDGIPLGVIAISPANTSQIVTPGGIADLQFGDEVEAINRTADVLDFFGVKAITVLLHRGDEPAVEGGPNDCNVESGPARDIALRASPKVDVIFTADSHQQYNCEFPDPAGNPRVVMQGASHGRIVSVADVTIDRNTREVVRDQTSAFNQIVTHDISPDPDIQALADRAWSEASDSAQRPVGTITADLTRDRVPSGESTLGNLVADAQLAAGSTRGAQLALTNPGGMREDLDFGTSGQVTYRQAYGVQPFGNSLEVLSVTGAVLKDALEQQFQIDLDGTATERILSPSAGFTYALDRRAAPGARISEMRLNGQDIAPDAVYSVVVNKFLAEGGDGFTALKNSTQMTGAGNDLDALTALFAAGSPVSPPATDRIRTIG